MSPRLRDGRPLAIDPPTTYRRVERDRRKSAAIWLDQACKEMRERLALCWCGRPSGHQARHRNVKANERGAA